MHNYSQQDFMGTFDLTLERWTNAVLRFPERGIGYTLVDFQLLNGTVVKCVPVTNVTTVCLYTGMPVFGERDIASVSASSH